MANSANMTYLGSGPAFTGQIVSNMQSGSLGQTLYGHASFTGDAATATATINWIDGVAVLPFIPSGVLVFKGGVLQVAGNATTVVQCVSSITNTSCLVTFSGNVPASVVDLVFLILK